ncbi:hypothetical protein DVA81_19310, partial [Acinetobacter baumannii]
SFQSINQLKDLYQRKKDRAYKRTETKQRSRARGRLTGMFFDLQGSGQFCQSKQETKMMKSQKQNRHQLVKR